MNFNDKEKKCCNNFNDNDCVTVRVYHIYVCVPKGSIPTIIGPTGLPMLTTEAGLNMMITGRLGTSISGQTEKCCGTI